MHEGHRHNGKGLIDLPQIDITNLPAKLCKQLLRRRHRRGGKPLRGMGVAGMAADPRPRLQPLFRGDAGAGDDKGGGAVGNRRGVGGGHCPVPGKSWFQLRDFLRPGLRRLFVGIDGDIALASGKGHRRDLTVKAAVLLRGTGIGKRLQRIVILGGSRELVSRRAILGKASHQPAAIISVLQPVKEHVILQCLMPEACPTARAGRQIGRIGHAFHPASNDKAGGAGADHVMRHHHRAHARPANLVHRRGRHRFIKAGGKAGLARRCLADTGRQHTAHQHFTDHAGIRPAIGKRRADRRAAKLRRRHGCQVTLKAAHRRAGSPGNDNIGNGNIGDIGGIGHDHSPRRNNKAVWMFHGTSKLQHPRRSRRPFQFRNLVNPWHDMSSIRLAARRARRHRFSPSRSTPCASCNPC